MQQTDTSVILSARHARLERVAIDHTGLPGLHAWRVNNRVGEAPNWCSASQTLLWIDVRAPAVQQLDPRTDKVTIWQLPEVVGAMGLAAAGSVVLALRRSLALLNLESGRLQTLLTVDDEPLHNRLNDGKVSPSGRWFVFGSMDERPDNKQASGALYCAGREGPARRLHGGLTVANGIAFSPNGQTLYFSDSHAGRVWHAAWDEAKGVMGAAVLLCSSDESAGRPDGAAVDSNGHYWSAGVSAGCLNRISPNGELLERVPLPCRAPTMPCFGGEAMTDLYVTSLVRPAWAVGPSDLDGAILSWRSTALGQAVPRWR